MARKYDHEYKVQAVKLAKEIGGDKAAKELGITKGTIHTWLKSVRTGQLDIGEGSHTPVSAMSLSEEITLLRKRVKEQEKEIRRLKKENEFLEEASAFFAANHWKSAKTRECSFWRSRQKTAGSKGQSHFIAVCLISAAKASIDILLTKTAYGSTRIWRMP